jgi:RNA polymerase sigma-70 factor (family 1)
MSLFNGKGPSLRYTAGDRKTFTAIFHAYYEPLCFFAATLLNNPSTAEDIVSEVLTRFWESNNGFAHENQVKAWLYKTTRNQCFNHLRRAKKGYKFFAGLEPPPSDETVVSNIIRAEVVRQVLALTDDLPPKCKEIFRLSYLEGLSNTTIAQQLGLSIFTVKNQKARALALIKKRMGNIRMLVLASFFPAFLE